MDDHILQLLSDPSPDRRREGVDLAARSGDRSYIKVLGERYQAEADPALKALIKQTALHLRDGNSLPAPSTPPTPTPSPAQMALPPLHVKPQPAPKRRPIPLWLFTLILLVIGAGVIWSVAGPNIMTRLAIQQLVDKVAHAASLPKTPPKVDESLNGAVYNTRVSAFTSYIVVEPTGAPPPGGWSVVVVLHGAGGNGLSEIPAYLAPAARDRVILVAPTFDQSIDFTYEMVYADLREILKQLKAHYPINQPASIITGFSWGARVAQFYSVVYIQDYGGAVIGGSREYMTVPANSPVRYAIFVGAQDFFDNVNRPQLAQAFVNNLAKQNKPAWHFEITPGVGHERVTRQIDKTFELITVLRAGNH